MTQTGTSPLDRIREQAEQTAAGKTVDLPIAGYTNPELIARYRWIDIDESGPIGEQIASRYDATTERILYGTIDLLIEACDGLYMRDPGDEELQPVTADGDGVARYDDRLEQALGREPSGSARAALRAAFKGNSYAIVEHGQQLQRWMSDPTLNVRNLLGKA